MVNFWNIFNELNIQKFQRVSELIKICPVIYTECNQQLFKFFDFSGVSKISITL
jgi:hypothetical protein